MECSLCNRINLSKEGGYSFLIHEFKHSFLYLGEHQFYPGYCVLVTKQHFKEMTDIPRDIRLEFFDEMTLTSKAIENVMQPTKMNLCSLGNVVPHMHWHYFPRFSSDPNFTNPPWLQMHEFDSAKIHPNDARPRMQQIRDSIINLTNVRV
jgi:diadenosine tetraphosphate (Ap4A) HIT family hydrolase